jgi:hypothetical protein
VARLVDKEQAAEPYALRFEAGGLPRGLYFYRVQVGEAAAVRTLSLVN